jgi:restriction system protein
LTIYTHDTFSVNGVEARKGMLRNFMNSSDKSDGTDRSDENPHLIPKHGGYRKLRSFQAAQMVYDATVIFCDRFIDRRSRTHDQMVQAARSGVRNIEEGSMASATSKKTELKLTSVARASLEELLGDCEDFLRHHGLPIWDKNSPEAQAVRRRYQADSSSATAPSDPYHLKTAQPETAANTLLCLINQASYLLRRQLTGLERDFLEHGGFSERLFAVRTQTRKSDRSDSSDKSDQSNNPQLSPTCPLCAKPMRLRTARQGSHKGSQFWGCSGYPDCRGARPAAGKPPGAPN